MTKFLRAPAAPGAREAAADSLARRAATLAQSAAARGSRAGPGATELSPDFAQQLTRPRCIRRLDSIQKFRHWSLFGFKDVWQSIHY